MSTVIMAACWPLQGMSATQKSVLISLADNANDQGVCWPSVGNIAMRTCLSERAVQGAIQWLIRAGVLMTDTRVGRSTMYTVTPEAYTPPQEVHPRSSCTPEPDAPRSSRTPPPQDMHPTPAAAAPPPRSSCTQNRNRTNTEPSGEPQVGPPALEGQPGKVVPLKRPKRQRKNAQDEQARQDACRQIWNSYSAAYLARWKTMPIRNAKVNAQVNDLLKRLGTEAHHVAGYFVTINDAYLIRNCHDFGSLLAKAESFRTQWATNTQMTGAIARQAEGTQTNLSAMEQALQEQRSRRKGNAQ